MHVLIVKTSSLGDVIHTLPAVTDALAAVDDLRFDWLVEEAFAPILHQHPGVDRVIPVALRRRVKNRRTARGPSWRHFLKQLQARHYDRIIDAQGLLKSAWLCLKARGPVTGLSWKSAREPLASLAYGKHIPVPWDRHAIHRVRALFAGALNYSTPQGAPDYGLEANPPALSAGLRKLTLGGAYLVFLHATTWTTKQYPEAAWRTLLQLAVEDGQHVLLPWGDETERRRAQRLCVGFEHAHVVPKQNLHNMAALLAAARGVVSVDTGLSHLAAAFNTPLVGLYGATDPLRTGTLGKNQIHLAADLDCAPCLKRACRIVREGDPPCYQSLTPQRVWEHLKKIIRLSHHGAHRGQ